jgi:lipopolysaccharide/colanic/teichoic acid biosynthesis glycosyltransferase
MAKRLFDIAVAGLLLILAAPVMLVIAVAHRLEGRVPVLWRYLHQPI